MQMADEPIERLTFDSLVEDLTQQKTVVVGSLDKIRHDLGIDATNTAIDVLSARLEAKFANLTRVSTEEPETIYEMRTRQDDIVSNINRLADQEEQHG